MAYKHILVPYDKSETAGRALAQAVEMASNGADAVIDILYVTSMPDIASRPRTTLSSTHPTWAKMKFSPTSCLTRLAATAA